MFVAQTQIELQIAQTENALSIRLGRSPGPIPRGKSICGFALPAVPAGAPSTLLERPPDILQAEQSLFPAELTLATVRASVFNSAANTYKAMGGGWVTEADKLTTGGVAEPATERAPRQPLF
jgi:multidrug efflux system outer membrane protein